MRWRNDAYRSSACWLVAAALWWSCAPTPQPQPAEAPAPTGEWLGWSPPGDEAALFGPGVVSTGLYERDFAATPDGRELYWTVFAPGSRRGTIVAARRDPDDRWSGPEIPALFRGHNSLEPFVTADGLWLWFASTRPLPGETEEGDWNLWRAPRKESGWGAPEPLPAPINEPEDEYYPTLTRDGAVLFTAARQGGLGGEDLWLSRPTDSGWAAPENLGPAINSPGPEFNALIHPDGRWILFGSVREGDAGGGDLYISFAAADGSWTPAEALPEPFNSPALDFCPALSPDGRILFWSSRRELGAVPSASSYGELSAALSGPGNGQCDIFWIAARRLDELAGAE